MVQQTLLVLSLGALLLSALPRRVQAQDPAQAQDPQHSAARIPFARAQAYYEAGRYGLAAQEFRASYDLLSAAGHPRALMVLLNLGRALERIAGREEEARIAYQLVIDESPRTPAFEDTLQRATDGLRELNARIGSQPGEPEAAISPIGPTVLALGGAMLVPGLIMAAVGLAQNQEIIDRCPELTGCDESLSSDVEATFALGLAADVLWIIGAGVALAGLVLTLTLEENGDGEATQAQLRGVHGGGLVALGGRFQ